MNITLHIGSENQHRIDYGRNWLFGTEKLFADGQLIRSSSVLSPSDCVNFPLRRRYEFTLGTTAPMKIVFEREQPSFLAAIRPHTYRVFVDDQLVYEAKGY